MDQAVAGVAPLPAPLPPPVGARPLRNPKHERYARARSILMPKIEAYRYAGLGGDDTHADRGNASKLERKQPIIDRITWLCRQDEDVLAEKRRRLEEFLWLVHDSDPCELWEVRERPKLDDEGEPIIDAAGETVMVRHERAKFVSELPEDLRRVVEAIEVTKYGDVVPKTYSKMQANQELRKLLGIGAVRDDLAGGEFERLSDEQLFSELVRLANELQVPVTLGIGVGS